MNYTTPEKYSDGFGAQYQRIIMWFLSSKISNLIFHYRPFDKMEHNYNNDPNFIVKKETLINLKNNIPNVDIGKYLYSNAPQKYHFEFFDKNMEELCKSEHMAFIKQCFWSNKDRDFFKNEKINVAVHIRRPNNHDNRLSGADTPDNYYLNVINKIRRNYPDKSLLFHIYSQGHPNSFKLYENVDTCFHLNEDIENTFIGMVAAELLVTSGSSFSYAASLISDGEIWYKPFWHPPLKKWIICE